jgi:hypothetical protein
MVSVGAQVAADKPGLTCNGVGDGEHDADGTPELGPERSRNHVVNS